MATRAVNINMRTKPREKQFLQETAEIAGFSNLTNFIMTAARKEANRILSDTHTTYLSVQDWNKVKQLFDNPPQPNRKLRTLMSNADSCIPENG